MLQYKSSPFWIGGDFNLPDFDWSLKSIVKHQYCKEINEVFLESLDVINAEQIVDFPTRGDNTLDLLLTNRVSLLNKCCDIPGLGDHQSAILADIECHPKKQKPISRKIYLWNEANHELLRETIQQNVESFIATNDIRTPVNTLWEKFSFFVSNTQDKYVPSKTSSVRYSQSWFTSHCKKLVRKKKNLYQKAKKSKLSIDWDKYRSAATVSRKACHHAYNEFIKNCLYENNNSNPKRLYSYIKNKQVDNFGVGPLKDNGKVYTEGKDKARILNTQFASVFSTDKGDIPLI